MLIRQLIFCGRDNLIYRYGYGCGCGYGRGYGRKHISVVKCDICESFFVSGWGGEGVGAGYGVWAVCASCGKTINLSHVANA